MSFMSNRVKSCHSSEIMSFMSNHVIHVKSCHSCQILSLMSNHVIHVKSCHSFQIMSFMSNYVIHVKSCQSCQIMSFMSNHVIHVKSKHSSQIISFMSNHVIHVKSCQIIPFISNHVIHVIHVKSCHSWQIMSFMSNHVIHVKSFHSCQIMWFMSKYVIHVKSCQLCQIMSNHVIHVKSCHSWLFQEFSKAGRVGEGGQIGLPKTSATASMSSQRQKHQTDKFGMSEERDPSWLVVVSGLLAERTYRNREATTTTAPLFAGTVCHHQGRAPTSGTLIFLLVYLKGNLISNNLLPLQFSRKTLSFNALGQSPTFYYETVYFFYHPLVC
jgi:hypothetical protein